MTTSTWNDGTADWYTNNGGDWTPAGDPGPSSAVVINSGEPELESGDAAISVASISITGGLLAIQDPGITQSVSGNVSLSGNGALALDGGNIGGAGGSSLTIGGTLTNSSTNALDIGNTGITSADTLTVNGAGGLTNGASSTINIEGNAAVQATLDVANAAAGFGTAGVETGTVFLQEDALLEFKSGQITTVDGQLLLVGSNALVADAGKLTTNSALTGLSSVTGNFWLSFGATVATTGALSVAGNGSVSLDNRDGGAGGSSLTIGGTLTNSSTNALDIGNTGITSADTLTVNGAGGLTNGASSTINIEGNAAVQATLDVANAAAGFGTAGVETGTVFLQEDALLEFKSGQITTVDGQLLLVGSNALVADAGKLTTNSALTGLSSVAGNFWLSFGATVATTGALSVTGNGTLGLDGNNTDGPGGSSLTVGGTLTNSSTNNNGVSVGNTGISSADILTVNGTGGLSNASTSEINIFGSATVQATVNVANAAAGFGTAGEETGTVWLQNDALLEFKSGQITTVDGELWLDGANSRVADASSLTTNSALTGLTGVSGNFYLENGATVATTGALSVTGNGTLGLDGNNTDGPGGSSLTVGGKLTNSSTNNNGVSVGNTGITSADSLTVNGVIGISNTGEINIEGSATVQATVNVANAAAGFGTTGVETGTVFLENDALLEFKSGQIATVDGELWLDGANARVARAAAPATNSALTGLTTVSGSFYLENGAKVSPTGNVSVTGGGTMELDGNNTDGGGGSSLTIAGTLTNSSTNGQGVDVGNTGITSADTLTLNGAGGLSNTGQINIVGGSASAVGTLDVTKTATSSGTIDINAFGELKAATVDVTGGSVVINASGDLTATATNVTGGTVEGVGTVTGALNDTGGTVVGGTLNSTTGTLNLDGAYEQSGSGVLQTDINTGDSQQSSIIAATGTPGTPGAAGSVNLAGGVLLIDAQSSLALNTPYTVMTFGADDLYGQFGEIETEGSLGSHTGNGDTVNLGNGDTLEVLYNEASGDVQVEVVTTPASTTYTWDVGSGTWNASSGADWNPPGNSTTPNPTSNVTIGTGGGGTVTLAADQTINSLSITNGYTLSGATKSITTTGSVSVASGAVLSIDDMNVGTTFADDGSATFAGYLTINGSGQFTLSNGTLSGGINGTGTFETVADTTGTLENITISKGTTYTASNGATTDISGTMAGQGTLQVNGGDGNNGYLVLTGAMTLSGGGALSLTTVSGGGMALVQGNGETLTNASDVIEGTGEIGNSSLKLINGGTIDADSPAGTGTLILNGSGGTTNADGTTGGLMEATSGGTLEIDDITIDNLRGKITADGGTVELVGGAVVEGGTLSELSSGTLETGSGQTATLNGTTHGALTISAGSTYTASNNETTYILGTITDKGTIQVIGGDGDNGILYLNAATTLSGGGVVTMTSATGGGGAYVEDNGETLTNADTIEGTGTIGNGTLAVINGGTIDVDSSAGTGILVLDGSGGITNANGATAGLLEATSGGTLEIDDITVNNAGGAITANDGTVQVLDATIQGGTLNALGGGTMASAGTTATLDGSTNGALTISAGTTYTASNDETTYILGTIIDKGTIQLNGGDGDNGIVYLNGATTLSGGGTLSLTSASGGGGAYVEDDGETLTNADTIEGIGIIGNGSLALTSSGTINANSSAGTLTLNGTGGITNTGVFEATAGGHLYVDGALSGAGQLKIGANAEVELGGATSENTTFLSATAATLLIDNATTTTYAGVISSFAKGDILELGNTDATKATPTFNSGPDTTTLTVDLSSGGPLVYTLAGNLSSDTFGVTVSGSNSSIAITADPAFEEAASLLGGHTASPFVESSGVFGASNTAGSAQLNLAGSLHAHSLT
jgi:hypothetical protein